MEGEHYEAIYDGAGAIRAKFLRGVVVDEIVNGYYYDASGAKTNYTFHHDHLQSVVGLSGHNGDAEQTVAYAPFGEQLSATGSSPNMLGYTGRELDSETGLYYYRARYYDPEIGRFLNEDPLGFEAGKNFYAYCKNNPINFNDPTGFYTGLDDAVFMGGGALVGLAGQGVVDLFRGELSNWQDYVAAGVGGAVAGEALLYTGPVGAGAIGGATSNIVKQRLNISTGIQDNFDFGSLAFDTTIGAATGYIPGVKIPGITQGRNSYNAIFNQMVTKFENGTISSVTTQTAAKMFVGRAVDTSLVPGAAVAATAGFGYSELMNNDNPNYNDFGDPNLNFPTYASVFSSDSTFSAGGGFVLYPNKPNTNIMRAVYSK